MTISLPRRLPMKVRLGLADLRKSGLKPIKIGGGGGTALSIPPSERGCPVEERRGGMPQPKCRKRPLSLGRRMLCDYLHFSGRGQTAAAERLMQLADVVAARCAASPRPSWGAIMTKAFALAARNHPPMRSAYFSFPWGHIGEYESQIASVIVDRRVGDEDVIFLAPLVRPEEQSLQALDAHLRRYKEEPVETFRAFREAMLLGRLPGVLRRFLWWLSLNVLPRPSRPPLRHLRRHHHESLRRPHPASAHFLERFSPLRSHRADRRGAGGTGLRSPRHGRGRGRLHPCGDGAGPAPRDRRRAAKHERRQRGLKTPFRPIEENANDQAGCLAVAGEDPGNGSYSLTGGETLRDLENWDSLSTMTFIAMADKELGLPLPGNRVARCQTVDDLLELLGAASTNRAA